MRLGHIEIFVRDPLASRNFYRDVLGFQVVVVQNERFVWLRSGEHELLLRPRSDSATDSADRYDHARLALVLYTDDLAASQQALLVAGVTFGAPDGPDCCLTFQDPDGHWIQLVDPNKQQEPRL